MALPPGFGIEEMRCLLEQSGVGVTVKKKPANASHLNSSEVQFCLRGHKVTSGIIEHDSNKKKACERQYPRLCQSFTKGNGRGC